MSRRVRLPAADDLFRATDQAADAAANERPVRAVPAVEHVEADQPRSRRTSGRVRHDEKMTVYVTADELIDMEHARLGLRRDHGLAVDRGRLVREAVALVLADFEEHGHDSMLVQRLFED